MNRVEKVMQHICEGKLSFEEYYEMYYQQALKYTIKKVSSFDVAEDLVMESFASCYRKFDEFNPEKAKFATWFYVVLENKIKNYYRGYKKSDYDTLEEHLELTDSQEDELFTAVHIKELRELLAEALNELPDLQRKIVILKYFGNKTSKEIAVECGIPKKPDGGINDTYVRMQLSRTLDKLKSYFEKNNVTWE